MMITTVKLNHFRELVFKVKIFKSLSKPKENYFKTVSNQLGTH